MELQEAVKFLKHHRKYLAWDGKSNPKIAKVKPKVLYKAIGVILKEIKVCETYNLIRDEKAKIHKNSF